MGSSYRPSVVHDCPHLPEGACGPKAGTIKCVSSRPFKNSGLICGSVTTPDLARDCASTFASTSRPKSRARNDFGNRFQRSTLYSPPSFLSSFFWVTIAFACLTGAFAVFGVVAPPDRSSRALPTRSRMCKWRRACAWNGGSCPRFQKKACPVPHAESGQL